MNTFNFEGTFNPGDQPPNNQNSIQSHANMGQNAETHHKRPIALYVPPAFRQSQTNHPQ